MNFIQYFKLFQENRALSTFIKNEDFSELLEYNQRNNKLRDFLKMLNFHDVPIKENTTGVLIIRAYSAPVRIVEIVKGEDSGLILEKTNGKDFEDMTYLFPPFIDRTKKQVKLYDRFNYAFISEKNYNIFSKWLVFLERNDELEEFLNDTDLQITILKKPDLIKTENDTLQSVKQKYQSAKTIQDINKYRSNREGPEGRIVLEFEDGWKWISLDKGYCADEGNAAGHCGNASPKQGENILSLRDNNNRVHITMVEKNGVTNEFKGVGNKKPKEYTHKYIVGLLTKTEIIRKIGEGKYLPQNDFHLEDLDEHNITLLKKSGFLSHQEGQDNEEEEWYQIITKEPDKFPKYYKEEMDQELPKFDRFDEDTSSAIIEFPVFQITGLHDSDIDALLRALHKTASNDEHKAHTFQNTPFVKWMNSRAYNGYADLFSQLRDNTKNRYVRTFLCNLYYLILQSMKSLKVDEHIPSGPVFNFKFHGNVENAKYVSVTLKYKIEDIYDFRKISQYTIDRAKKDIEKLQNGYILFAPMIADYDSEQIAKMVDKLSLVYPFYKKL